MIKAVGSKRKTSFKKADRGLIINSNMGVKLTEHEANDILRICFKYGLKTEEVLNIAFIEYPHMDYKEAIRELIFVSNILDAEILKEERAYYHSQEVEEL